MQNAGYLGCIAMARLDRMSERHRCIGQIRGRGLMIGVEIAKDRHRRPACVGMDEVGREPAPALRDRVIQEAFGRGLLTLGCGESAIRICPPLCIERKELETGLAILEDAVTAAESG